MISVRMYPFLFVALALSMACSPTYIANSPVEATEENLEVWTQVEEYRVAMEERDVDRLMNLVSREYFDNFATTDRNDDDYGYEMLRAQIVPILRNNAKKVRVKIRLTALVIDGDRAEAEFEYKSRFLVSEGGSDTWETRNDFNRIAFTREGGVWKIIEGL